MIKGTITDFECIYDALAASGSELPGQMLKNIEALRTIITDCEQGRLLETDAKKFVLLLLTELKIELKSMYDTVIRNYSNAGIAEGYEHEFISDCIRKYERQTSSLMLRGENLIDKISALQVGPRAQTRSQGMAARLAFFGQQPEQQLPHNPLPTVSRQPVAVRSCGK